MAEFIVRARAAPADPDRFLASVGRGAGVEYLADITRSALFIARGHRDDTTLHLVIEKSRDYSRTVTLHGGELGTLGGLHEQALLELIASGLRAGIDLAKDESRDVSAGLQVRALSFEHLVRDRAASRPSFMLDRRGEDIRTVQPGPRAVFILTDHTPMPKKSFNSMARQGVRKLSLGPVFLHAAHCISVVHNELDRLAG